MLFSFHFFVLREAPHGSRAINIQKQFKNAKTKSNETVQPTTLQRDEEK